MSPLPVPPHANLHWPLLSALLLETRPRPPGEHLGPRLRPGPVARHGAVAQPLQDLGGVLPYLVAGPQVEREPHGRPVPLAEKRPYVPLEPHRLIRPGQRNARLGGSGIGTSVLPGCIRAPAWAPVPARYVPAGAGRRPRREVKEAGERRAERRVVRQAGLVSRLYRQRGPARSLRGAELPACQRRRSVPLRA